MSLFTIAGLSISILCVTLAVIILIYAKEQTHYLWAFFNLAIFAWAISTVFVGIAKSPPDAALAWRCAYGLGSFVPSTFYHFIYSFCELKKKTTLIIVYATGFIFIPICFFAPGFINKIDYVFNSIYYHRATPLFDLEMVYLCSVVFLSFSELIKYSRKATGKKHTQVLYVLYGFAIGWGGGMSTFLVAYNVPIYPAWHFSICFYTLLMTYAIFKHQLMDINIIIRRSLIYSCLVTAITLIFLISVFISERLFHYVIHYQNITSSMIIVSLFALIFTPLKNKIQNLVDHAFFKASPIEIAQQIEELRQKEKTLVDLYNQADKLSKTDTLTEINNRRHFLEMMHQKMQDSESSKTSFYLVIFDVDRFKEINDGYGHTLGDMVLVKVVGVVKNNIRSNDFVGRFGGDEFVICLDFPNKEGIMNRLTKIRDDIKTLSFTHEGKEVPVSVSIGAAKFIPGTHMTEKSLIEKADAELFNVKKTTRGEISVNE